MPSPLPELETDAAATSGLPAAEQVMVARGNRWRELGALGLTALAVARICFWAAIPPVTDTDVWWVAAAGRDLLREHVVPHLNRYGFTDPLRPWTMHEWLFGPLYASGLSALGPRFFSLFALACAGVTSAVLVAACLARSRDRRLGALLAALVLTGFGMHLCSPRPPNVALFFAVAMAALAFAPRLGLGALISSVALELVWTNAHGSFLLGPLLLLAGAVAEAEDRKRRLLAAGAALAVTCVNPYGLALHKLVLGYALGSTAIFGRIHSYIVEFSPIWRASGQVGALEWVGIASLVLLALSCLARPGLRARGGVALALFALGALGIRHLALAGLVSAVVLAPALAWRFAGEARSPGASGKSPLRVRPALLGLLCVAPGVLVLLVVQLVIGGFSSTRMIAPVLGGPDLVALMAKVPKGARLFVPFRATGVAIWYRPDPSVRVFYDARNDCYSPRVADVFFALDAGQGTRQELRAALEHYGTDAAILSDGQPLAQALAEDPRWQVRARSGPWALRVRSPAVGSARPP